MIIPNPLDTARDYVRISAAFAYKTRAEGNLEISFKEGDVNNVLTNADLANSERAKVAFKPFLDAGEILIDEENLPAGKPSEILRSGKPMWVIDPIDGTRPFSTGKDSWGVMLSRVVGGKIVYANIEMPSMGQRLELYPEGGVVTFADGRNAFMRNLPTAKGSIVNVSNRVQTILTRTEAMGLKNVYAPSAAEMTINLALGKSALIAMPSKAGIWDVLPAMMLADLNGYVVFYENKPYEFFSLEPYMFEDNWQLKDNIIITSRELWYQLYPFK